jgi:hypothetical protein
MSPDYLTLSLPEFSRDVFSRDVTTEILDEMRHHFAGSARFTSSFQTVSPKNTHSREPICI